MRIRNWFLLGMLVILMGIYGIYLALGLAFAIANYLPYAVMKYVLTGSIPFPWFVAVQTLFTMASVASVIAISVYIFKANTKSLPDKQPS